MQFNDLYNFCFKSMFNESYNFFNDLYDLCLEAKSKKSIAIETNRANALKEYDQNKENSSDDNKREIKQTLIGNLLIPQKWQLIDTKLDSDGSVHYDISMSPNEQIRASISSNGSKESNILIVVKDINDPIEINNAIAEIEIKMQDLKKEETIYKRELESDLIHYVGYAPPSVVPERGYYKIGTKPFKDKYGRTRVIEYEVDPKTTVFPEVGSIEELNNQIEVVSYCLNRG